MNGRVRRPASRKKPMLLFALAMLLSVWCMAQPVITSVSPGTGNAGNAVTITGSGFGTTAATNVVRFGATRAVVSSATATSLVVNVPAGASYDRPSVTNLTTGLTGTGNTYFTPTYDNSVYASKLIGVAAKVAVTGGGHWLAASDLDGDGKPDLIAATGGSISIRRNTSTSGTLDATSFAASQVYTGGGNFVVAVDLDRDGKTDVVSYSYSGYKLTIFRNTSVAGSISFSAAYQITTSYNFSGIAAGDVDGDGKPEILVTDYNTSVVAVFKNTSSPGAAFATASFGTPVTFVTGSRPEYLALTDLDMDGKADIVTANDGDNTMSVLRNTATSGTISASSFAAKVNFAGGSIPYYITTADLDGDGRPEIIVPNRGANSVSVWKNLSTTPGTISLGTRNDIYTLTYGPASVAVADMNGDSKPDLLLGFTSTSDGAYGTSVLQNSGNLSSSGDATFNTETSLLTKSSGYIVVATDLDGDGKPDIALPETSSGGSVALFRNTPFVGLSTAITGTLTVCTGGSTAANVRGTTTLSHATTGGTWSSSNPAVASISTAGVVTGVAVGTAIITYTAGTARAASVVTVSFGLSAITGSAGVCAGAPTTLAGAAGSWSSSVPSVATVGTTGIVTGVSAGTTTITLATGATCYQTKVITSGITTITGITALCSGGTTSLSAVEPGGKWKSGNTARFTVDSMSGLVTGVSAGTALISYTLGGCVNSTTVTVNITPTAIAGTGRVCAGSTRTLSNTVSGGTWSSSNTAIAGVDTATGIVTGVTAGTASITYATAAGACRATAIVTVDVMPTLPAVSGPSQLCYGTTGTLTNTTPGGTWLSSKPSAITISSTGAATGITHSFDSTIITYTLTGPCGSAAATRVVYTNIAPVTGTLSGIMTLCAGTTTTLASTVSGGTWSTADAAKATINSSGVVTGVGGGTVTISYAISNSCGSSASTAVVTVNTTPAVAAITGNTALCPGFTSTLASATTGGLWVSTSPGVASVSTTGLLTAISAGYAGVVYILSNGCGPAVATASVTVINPPAITGSTGICLGSSAALATTLTGGTWSSVTGSVATIDAASGVVNGVAAGTSNITYTKTGCTTAAVVTVSAAPNAGTITGTGPMCAGDVRTLGNTTTGGTWTSSNTTVATIGTTGIAIAVAPGAVSISYTKANACSTATATATMTVDATPNAGTISGYASICATMEGTTYTNTATGGTWSSSNTGVATINASGAMTRISAGVTMISYTVTNACGTAYTTKSVTILPLADAGTLTGASAVCEGGTTTLACTATGYWSSSSTAAGIGSASGIVTGSAAGTAIITFTATGECGTATATKTITVNPAPYAGVIGGASTVYSGSTITLSNATTGGAWSSSNTATATIGTSGIVTAAAAGTTIISYTISNSCGTAVTTKAITVTAVPSAGAITGPATVCHGSSSTLTNSVGGGNWSSSNTSVATINAAGIVNGLAVGTTIISYVTTDGTTTATATQEITVNPLPNSGAITGAAAVCAGSSTTLANTATGGVWSSSNAVLATTGSTGIVTGVTAGTAAISYTVTNSCGTATAAHSLTVVPVLTAGTLSGATTVCRYSIAVVSSTATGGTWSTSNTAVAAINTLGIVSGIEGGAATISYSVNNMCGSDVATHSMSVNIVPGAGAITGASEVCAGSLLVLGNTASGGNWSTSSAGAMIDGTGVLSGLSAGTVTISYIVSNSCGAASATKTVTVAAFPDAGTITGPALVCPGTGTTLSGTTAGGTWSSSNTAAATTGAGGIVTGVAAGATIISYSVTNVCGTAIATRAVAVTPLPDAGTITGITTVCATATTTLSNAAAAGNWSSANTAVATINTEGIVTGVTAGAAIISYSVTNACGTATATTASMVNPLPVAGTLAGAATVCAASSTTLTSTVSGGTWSTSNAAVASAGTAGVVTGVAGGVATITYTVTNGCGAATTSKAMTVNALADAGFIGGVLTACAGTTATVSAAVTGGTWSSSDTAIATIDTAGIVSGVAAGDVMLTYTVSNMCGSAWVTAPFNVLPLPVAGTIDGNTPVCTGGSITLSTTTAGGTWSSDNSGIATAYEGIVTGVTEGNTAITYTVTNGCGSAMTDIIASVNPLPDAGTISGPSAACKYGYALFSTPAEGGEWTTSDPDIASISPTGWLYGLSAGTTTVSYTLSSSCGTSIATTDVSILAYPVAGTLSGSTAVCLGGTTTFTSTVPGGTWTSMSASIASVDAGGVVTGVAGGSIVITYSMHNVCGTAYTTRFIFVAPVPVAGTLTGPGSVCMGETIDLEFSSYGGSFSSTNDAIATVDYSGHVTGISPGFAVISYTKTNACATVAATRAITVTNGSITGTISGPATVTAGAAITLSDGVAGGTWNASNGNVTISASGSICVVTGVTTGVTTISYTVTSGCAIGTATFDVTVISSTTISAITGTLSLCSGTTTTLGNTSTGGTWSSSAAAVATVTGSGVVSGVSAGTAEITYTLAGAYVTAVVTVYATPPTFTGIAKACPGSSTTLSNAVAGGAWSSSNTSIATIDGAGVATGVATGTATISYEISGCMRATVLTVNVVPNAIGGTLSLCPGNSSPLTNSTTGGVSWTSSNTAVATIGSTSGVATGVAYGTATVTYTVGTGCYRTAEVTVNAGPAAVTGAGSVCAGATATLSNASIGGTWSSSAVGVATIGSLTGIITGVNSGVSTITYNAGGCKVTTSFTVSAIAAITGTASMCIGSSVTLGNTSAAGTWSSSNTAIATVGSATGVVTGITGGNATISYTIPSGCTRTIIVSVTATPVAIGGSLGVCNGTTATLTNAMSGGTWSGSNASVATINATSGVITGVGVGTLNVSYTLTGGCRAVAMATVNALPANITGTTNVCRDRTTTMADATAGGTWSSNNMAIAAIGSGSGIVTGLAAGTAMVSYTLATGCYKAMVFTVKALPAAISGSLNVCATAATVLTDATTGGVSWVSSNTAAATIGATSGLMTGVSAGTTTITYTVSTGCYITAVATVHAMPTAGTITGPATVVLTNTITLANTASGGVWSSSNAGVASITIGGFVTGIATGSTTISYTAANPGCSVRATKVVSVTASRDGSVSSEQFAIGSLQLYPNPTTGTFTIEAPEAGTFSIYTLDGREVSRYTIAQGAVVINLPNDLVNGIYMCRYYGASGKTTVVRLVYEH